MAGIDVFYIDLARAYAGAQIVNNASIRSFLAHTDIPNLPVAFDLYLRQLVFNGALKTRLVWSGAYPPNAELAPGESVVTTDPAAFIGVFARCALCSAGGWRAPQKRMLKTLDGRATFGLLGGQ